MMLKNDYNFHLMCDHVCHAAASALTTSPCAAQVAPTAFRVKLGGDVVEVGISECSGYRLFRFSVTLKLMTDVPADDGFTYERICRRAHEPAGDTGPTSLHHSIVRPSAMAIVCWDLCIGSNADIHCCADALLAATRKADRMEYVYAEALRWSLCNFHGSVINLEEHCTPFALLTWLAFLHSSSVALQTIRSNFVTHSSRMIAACLFTVVAVIGSLFRLACTISSAHGYGGTPLEGGAFIHCLHCWYACMSVCICMCTIHVYSCVVACAHAPVCAHISFHYP